MAALTEDREPDSDMAVRMAVFEKALGYESQQRQRLEAALERLAEELARDRKERHQDRLTSNRTLQRIQFGMYALTAVLILDGGPDSLAAQIFAMIF